jgi:hypothetical protein
MKVVIEFAEAARRMKLLPPNRIPFELPEEESPATPPPTLPIVPSHPKPRAKKVEHIPMDAMMDDIDDDSGIDDSDVEIEEPTPRNKGKARADVPVVKKPPPKKTKGSKKKNPAKRDLQDSPTRIEAPAKRARISEAVTPGGVDLGWLEVTEFDEVLESQVVGVTGKVRRFRESFAMSKSTIACRFAATVRSILP